MSKQYDTLVVTGMGNTVPRTLQHGGEAIEVTAWHSGHALDKLDKLETFVESLSLGLVEPEEIEAKAERLLEEIRKP